MLSKITKGQIEDLITKAVTKLYRETLGVGPKLVKTYLVHDMLIVRIQSPLLPYEKKLLKSKDGVELIKTIRKTLHELSSEHFSETIHQITNHKVVSTHSDISTITGERFKRYVLDTDYQAELEN